MKHASRETRRHRAMASAWELKQAEHYSKLLEIVHHDDREEYESSLMDECLIKPEDLGGLDDDVDAESLMQFNHEVYNEELHAFCTSDVQLTQLEEEFQTRLHDHLVVERDDELSFDVNRNKENV